MAICKKLKEFLDQNNVRYQVAGHPEVYTAQEIAASLHVPGKELAKVVMIKSVDRFVMTVLPASWRIDMVKLKDILKVKDVQLATEEEFKDLFPDCEVGAMPPFGNLYGFDVYVDKALSEDDEIFFQAGNHIESIKMTYKDYSKLVKPKVAEFGVHLH
ncbi:MAG: YbaK/EbsC family protein [Nitrospirae bacterium]|nr:YbaK/EbsC family protein [Nitrospirota bacterium]